MKKMLLLCILVVVLILILITFFVACKNNNSKYLYDKNGVLDLIRAKELSCEVINIKVVDKNINYTKIFIELYVPEKEFLTNEYFQYEQYNLANGISSQLTDYGINKDLISKFGINYKDFIIEKKSEKEYRPYYIYWFKLTESLQNKSNVLIYASIPYEITITET